MRDPVIWAVVPTKGDRDVVSVVDGCGLPRHQVVVVDTSLAGAPEGCRWMPMLNAPINIHRWWNLGMSMAEHYGATHIALLNDDIVISPDALPAMAAALDEAQADLCCVGEAGMTGWAFMLPRHGLRPDEAYRWYCGDVDLWARANHGRGVVYAGSVEHLTPGEHTRASAELQALAAEDQVTYGRRWAA